MVAANGGDHRSQPKGANIVMDANPDAPFYYVNHMEVSHTPHDFTLAVVQIPPKLTNEVMKTALSTGEVRLLPTLYVTFPFTLLPGLVEALNTQRKAFEDQNGPIREPASISKSRNK